MPIFHYTIVLLINYNSSKISKKQLRVRGVYCFDSA